jgi:hypothetical protein
MQIPPFSTIKKSGAEWHSAINGLLKEIYVLEIIPIVHYSLARAGTRLL